jgi:hypothetical protein
LRHDINLSDCFFIVGNIYNTNTDKMDMALDYVGLAATTGLSAYVLAQLLSGGSDSRQLYHGMTTAMAVGIATAVSSMEPRPAMIMSSLTSLRPISGRPLSPRS